MLLPIYVISVLIVKKGRKEKGKKKGKNLEKLWSQNTWQSLNYILNLFFFFSFSLTLLFSNSIVTKFIAKS